jgi:hypothetical protein
MPIEPEEKVTVNIAMGKRGERKEGKDTSPSQDFNGL